MAEELKIRVNDRPVAIAAGRDTPLLYVLANELGLQGPRFGCGLAQCGSCSVLLDGIEIRSCSTPVGAVEGKAVTTLGKGCRRLYGAARSRPAAGLGIRSSAPLSMSRRRSAATATTA